MRTYKFVETEMQAEGGNGEIVLNRGGDRDGVKVKKYYVVTTGHAGGRVTDLKQSDGAAKRKVRDRTEG